jgi:hypothetical protein
MAMKFAAFRMLLGGLVALWVAVVGAQALWHTVHFAPPQPEIINSMPQWPAPQPPSAPAPPKVAIINGSEQRALLVDATRKVIKFDRQAVEAEMSSSAQSASSLSTEIADEADAETENVAASAQETRPEWLNAAPKRIGNVARTVVSAGPWKTFDECAADLDVVTMKAVADYMRESFDADVLSTSDLRSMGITESYVRQNICTQQYVETSMHDFAGIEEEMYTVHVLMEFDPSARRFLENGWNSHERRSNLSRVSVTGGGVMALLALIYGLLKVDTWTKGYYSRRLLLGVPAVILVLGLIILALNAM